MGQSVRWAYDGHCVVDDDRNRRGHDGSDQHVARRPRVNHLPQIHEQQADPLVLVDYRGDAAQPGRPLVEPAHMKRVNRQRGIHGVEERVEHARRETRRLVGPSDARHEEHGHESARYEDGTKLPSQLRACLKVPNGQQDQRRRAKATCHRVTLSHGKRTMKQSARERQHASAHNERQKRLPAIAHRGGCHAERSQKADAQPGRRVHGRRLHRRQAEYHARSDERSREQAPVLLRVSGDEGRRYEAF